MDAEQEEYSEEEKDVGVSCNSEECQDIEQKTTVCLCFLLFYSSEKVAGLGLGLGLGEVNSFFLVFREWMQNKRSIPRTRKTLGSPATPRSARILHKKQWYVFVFYFFTLQKS